MWRPPTHKSPFLYICFSSSCSCSLCNNSFTGYPCPLASLTSNTYYLDVVQAYREPVRYTLLHQQRPPLRYTPVTLRYTPMEDPAVATSDWGKLSIHIQANPLLPAQTPPLFDDLPPGFLPHIYLAHAAGYASAFGTHSQPAIPESATTSALYAYFSQGFQYTLQQRLMPVPTQTLLQEPRDIKGREPDTFEGTNRDLYPAFVLQLTLLFANNPHWYPDDIPKIRAAGSYLRGHALNWFDPNCDKSTGSVNWSTYPEFLEAFKAAYDDPDRRATVEHKLLTLRQGGKTASAYYSEFTTYASILTLDEATKISFFRRGVNEELSLALSYQINLPTTFASFAQMCITLDNQVKIRRTRTKELSVNRARFLEPAPVIGPFPDPEP